jgi:succinate dehydrogenase / fumarate reductase cytochrome b subunit
MRENGAAHIDEGEVVTTTAEAPVRRRSPWPIEFYRSAVGKKWVMAITGIALLGYVVAHMVGNLKMYIGPASIDEYGEALRDLGGHLVPRTNLLWALRIGLLGAAILHVHAAYSLTYTNWKARGGRYRERDYSVVTYASRSMRLTGTVVLLFVVFHLADLTWGATPASADTFVRGAVYANMVASFSRLPVAIFYGIANIALGVHIFHGTWSLFQSLGWNHPRFNLWRKRLALGLTIAVIAINLSFPIAVQAGILAI